MQEPALRFISRTEQTVTPAAGTTQEPERTDIVKDGILLARHIRPGDFQKGLAFYSENEEFLQVGTWRYDNGHALRAHSHNTVQREITRTNEVVIVLQGLMAARIFDEERTLVTTVTVRQGEFLILMNGGHDYTILADDTRILEIKNGPFLGKDIDKTLF
jgi:hypothetical protein